MSLTLHHNFAEDKSLVARVGPTLSCTRALGTATQVNSSGLIEAVAANTARFDHLPVSPFTSLGLLVEEVRTNICLYSEDLSNAAWVASNVTKGSTSVTAPDGAANTAVRLTASAANGTILQTVTSASATRDYSVYMKRVTGTGNIDLTVDGGTTWTTKTLTADWTRFDITQAAVTNPQVGVRIVASGDAIDFWGSSLEAGAFPTSYIKTEASSVTRNADVVTVVDVSFYNENAGTLYADFINRVNPTISADRFAVAVASAANNQLALGFRNAGDTIYSIHETASGTDGSSLTETALIDTRYKAAAGYASNDLRTYSNGNAGNAVASVTVPASNTFTTLTVGASGIGNAEYWNGTIAEIRYYNTRLTDTELEDMSNGTFPSSGSSNTGNTGPGLTFGMMGKMGA